MIQKLKIDREMFPDIINKINEIIDKVNEPRYCLHNYVPRQYEGSWGASVPPPTMFCTKCGNWN